MWMLLTSSTAGSSNNGVGLTPTLGFSTWNWRQTCTTRAMVTPQVEAMVKRGLVKEARVAFRHSQSTMNERLQSKLFLFYYITYSRSTLI